MPRLPAPTGSLLEPRRRHELESYGSLSRPNHVLATPDISAESLEREISSGVVAALDVIRASGSDEEPVPEVVETINEHFLEFLPTDTAVLLSTADLLLPAKPIPRGPKKAFKDLIPVGCEEAEMSSDHKSFFQVCGSDQMVVNNSSGNLVDVITKEPLDKSLYVEYPNPTTLKIYLEALSNMNPEVDYDRLKIVSHDPFVYPADKDTPNGLFSPPRVVHQKVSSLKNLESLLRVLGGTTVSHVLYVGSGNGFTTMPALILNPKIHFILFDPKAPDPRLAKFRNVTFFQKEFSLLDYEKLREDLLPPDAKLLLYMDLFLKDYDDCQSSEEDMKAKVRTMELQTEWHFSIKPKVTRFKVYPAVCGISLPSGGRFNFPCFTKYGSLETFYVVSYVEGQDMREIQYEGYEAAIREKHYSRSYYHLSPYSVADFDGVQFNRTLFRCARKHNSDVAQVKNALNVLTSDARARMALSHLRPQKVRSNPRFFDIERVNGRRTCSPVFQSFNSKFLPKKLLLELNWTGSTEPRKITHFKGNPNTLFLINQNTVVSYCRKGKLVAKVLIEAGNFFQGHGVHYVFDKTVTIFEEK